MLEKLSLDLHVRAGLSRTRAFLSRHGLSDRWLLAAVACALLLGAQGFTWGRYDCLNVDAMAFRTIFAKDRPPGHPGAFLKPPFYTYVCHFTARLPAMVATGSLFWLEKKERGEVYFRLRLLLARALNFSLFAAAVVMMFGVVRSWFGLSAARASALLFATSATFVSYKIFLTTDMALVFMMLLSFCAAARIVRHPGMGISIVAGLLAGLSTATKYNGLAVAVALPLAHLLASKGNPILACLKRPSAWACGLAVPLGFFIGNPYAVFDWPKFSADFFYNYETTPVYGGVVDGNGYERFFAEFFEIFGLPGGLFLLIGIAFGIPAQSILRKGGEGWKLWVLAAAVFALYTWKIGAFPRIQTRFVLPMAPFVLLLAAAGFPLLFRWRWLSAPVLAMVIGYNLACSWWMGELFRQDPRMVLLDVLDQKMGTQEKVELSKSIPRIQMDASRDIKVIKMPGALERSAKFDEMFGDDAEMQGFKERWRSKEGPEWFSSARRNERNPGWIIWCSNDVEGIVEQEYLALYQPASGFEVAFDARSPERPPWAYPRSPEFIRNRTTLWQKAGSAIPPNP